MKALYSLGDSLSLDNASDFIKTYQTELKCIVQKTTNVYNGYLN
jgi:hypothetical protein